MVKEENLRWGNYFLRGPPNFQRGSPDADGEYSRAIFACFLGFLVLINFITNTYMQWRPSLQIYYLKTAKESKDKYEIGITETVPFQFCNFC